MAELVDSQEVQRSTQMPLSRSRLITDDGNDDGNDGGDGDGICNGGFRPGREMTSLGSGPNRYLIFNCLLLLLLFLVVVVVVNVQSKAEVT